MSEPIPTNGPWGQAIDNLKTLTDAQAITIITQNATIAALDTRIITLEATVTTQNTTIAALDARITVLEP